MYVYYVLTTTYSRGALLQSTAAVLLLCSLFGGVLQFWGTGGFVMLPQLGVTGGVAIIIGAIGLWSAKKVVLWTTPFLFGLAALTFSSFFSTAYTLFPAPTIRGELFLATAIIFFCFRYVQDSRVLAGTAVAACMLLAMELLNVTRGLPIISDDHATFLFRFTLLQDQFPNIPFYYPFWNGGLDARDFFPTGALNSFLLFQPLFALFDAFSIYTLVISLLLFVVVPGAAYAATRLLQQPSRTAALASLLALSSSLIWYRWALKYGTLGFLTSAALVPLGFALLLKYVHPNESTNYKHAFLTAVVISLILCWSLSGAVYLPLAVIALPYLFTLVRRKTFILLVALLLLVNIPWMAVMWEASSIGTLIAGNTASEGIENFHATPAENVTVGARHKERSLSITDALKVLRDKASTAQPLILLFALPGIFLFSKNQRRAFAATFIWLLVCGTFGVGLKPLLELDRMLVFASLIAVIPAAAFLDSMITFAKSSSVLHKMLTAHALSYACIGIFAVGGVLNNRSVEHFDSYSNQEQALADRIKELTPRGRVLFSGFVLHEFGGGHVAPLPFLTGNIPMVASSPFHNKWRYTNVIPERLLKEGEAGVETFLSLYNISTITAHEKAWRDYFLARPERYAYHGITSDFLLFTVKNFTDTYVLAGEADIVSQQTNGVTVIPKTSSVTLKFTYFPFLEAKPCHIRPAHVSTDITFIELYDCTIGSQVIIKAKSPLRRVMEH